MLSTFRKPLRLKESEQLVKISCLQTSAVTFFHKFYKHSVEVGLLMEVLTVNNVASWVYKMLNVSRIVQDYLFLEGKVFIRMSRVFFFSKKKKPLKK